MSPDLTELAGFRPIDPARADRYRAAGHWTGTTLGVAIMDTLRAQPPNRVVLSEGARQITAGELVELAGNLAARLAEAGLSRHDRMVVQLPNTAAFVVLMLAAWRIGVIPVMALPAYRSHELRHVLSVSGAVAMAVSGRAGRADPLGVARDLRATVPALRLLLVLDPPAGATEGERDLMALAQAPPRPAAGDLPGPAGDDVGLLLQSGGSTGLPKCIPRTHNDYLYNLRVSADICGANVDTVYLAALPVGHNFTLGCPGVFGTLLAGGRVALTANPMPHAVSAAVARHGATMTAAVPNLAAVWAEEALARPEPWRGLRLVQVGGARLFPGHARQLVTALGGALQQVYGMAEGLLNFTRLDDPDEVVLHTQGRPASPDDELRIVDPAGRELSVGETGELLARGPYTIGGYFADPAANQRAFTVDGFYRTGDLVRWHRSGNLVVEGRVKDVINRGGEKIAAAEIEQLALSHPGVAQAAAVAVPSRAHGEAICVFVVPRGAPLTLVELRTCLMEQDVARYKLPDRLELIDGLPVTPVGKVDKAALRDLVAGPS